MDSIACGYCDHEEECVSHILAKCFFARIVMEWVFKWCGIVAIQFKSIVEVLDFAAGWGNCPKKGDCY